MLREIILGIKRARGQKLVSVIAEGPLPADASSSDEMIAFPLRVKDAVTEINSLATEKGHYPKTVLVPRSGFTVRDEIGRGASETVEELISTRLPRSWKHGRLDLAIGVKVALPSDAEAEDILQSVGNSDRLTVISCSTSAKIPVARRIGDMVVAECQREDVGEVTRAILLSEYLRSCFPFSIWSRSQKLWGEFLEEVSKGTVSGGYMPDSLTELYGVPCSDHGGIEGIWASAAQNLLKAELSKTTVTYAELSELLVETWQPYGGAISRNEVTRKLAEDPARVFAARPRGFVEQPDIANALAAGDVDMVMTLNRPNPSRQEKVATMLGLPKFGKHKIGFVQRREIEEFKEFFQDDTLVRYDARAVRLALAQANAIGGR